MIDRVVRRRQRAMTTGIQRLELKIRVNLLAGLNRGENPLISISLELSAIEIDAVLRVDPLAMIFHQPVDAVKIAAFLIGGQRQNQIAIGLVILFLHANEVGDEDRVSLLHIVGAAPVEVAILLNKFKGIGRPVLTPCFDDVKMANEQDRLVLPSPVNARDEVLLPIIRSIDDDVVAGKSRIAKPSSRRLGRSRNVADGIGRINLNELLKNLPRQWIRRFALRMNVAAGEQSRNSCNTNVKDGFHLGSNDVSRQPIANETTPTHRYSRSAARAEQTSARPERDACIPRRTTAEKTITAGRTPDRKTAIATHRETRAQPASASSYSSATEN